MREAGRPGERSGPPAALTGWVLPGIILLLGGACTLVALAWGHLNARTAPVLPVFLAVCLALGLADFHFAVHFELSPSRRADTWRPVLVLALAVGGALTALIGRRPSVACGIVTAILLAFVARAAETLGRHLGPALRLPSDAKGGEWPRQSQETRHIVLETWLLAAGAAAVGHVRAGALPASVAMAVGGLGLVIGAKMDALGRGAVADGFQWAPADRARAWRGGAAVAAGALLLGAMVPGLPPVLSWGLLIWPLRGYLWMLERLRPHPAPAIPASRSTATVHLSSAKPHAIHGASAAAHGQGLSGGWMRLAALLRNFALDVAIAAAVVVIVVQYLRHVFDPDVADWREALRRLWADVLSVLAFWRWWGVWAGHLAERRFGVPATAGVEDAASGSARGRGLLSGFMDPRRVVRACYRRLLRAGAAAGSRRHPADTPAAYERRIGPVAGPGAPDVTDLSRAYEEARFSHHPIGRHALARVRASAAGAVAALRARRRA